MRPVPAMSAEERRAMGMVRNGAEDYEITPPFLSYRPDGQADLYRNTVIGLAVKWLGFEPLTSLFASWSGSSRAGMFDGIAWLGIEHYVYEKELPLRPYLAALRRECAAEFFSGRGGLSRQQMMSGGPLLQQQAARWESVLGRDPRFVFAKEKRLKEALELSGDLAPAEVLRTLREIIAEYFRFSDFRLSGAHRPSEGRSLFLRKERSHRDSLLQRGDWEDAAGGQRMGRTAAARAREEADREYIEACFGRPCLSARELARMEKVLCQDAHAFCRLWVCKSRPEHEHAEQKESLLFAREAAEQAGKNADFIRKERVMVQAGIRSLSARLAVMLENFAQELPETGVRGRLMGERAYRMPLLQDPAVFLKPAQDPRPDLSVDLLLDASASRTASQEMIAAQAYMLAESMMKCQIPVRVLCFRSLRGYTVLQILKEDKDRSAAPILQYFAGGWNRDGLALKALEYLDTLREDRSSRRLLLVLTDAHPSDSTEMPPEGRSPLKHNYEGAAAIEDTAAAAADLRKKGIRIAAVFTGSHSHLEALKTIYGNHFVRIRHMEQLAQEAGTLLEQELIQWRG